MVNSCLVYGCKSNNNNKDKTDYVKIFKFPEESERRAEWIRKIPNRNLIVSKNSRVCIKHFEENDIKRFDIFKCQNGDPDIKVSIYLYILSKQYND